MFTESLLPFGGIEIQFLKFPATKDRIGEIFNLLFDVASVLMKRVEGWDLHASARI